MEKDAMLRKFVRETITEVFEKLEKELLGSEQIAGKTSGTIEEQLTSPEAGKEKPKTDK